MCITKYMDNVYCSRPGSNNRSRFHGLQTPSRAPPGVPGPILTHYMITWHFTDYIFFYFYFFYWFCWRPKWFKTGISFSQEIKNILMFNVLCPLCAIKITINIVNNSNLNHTHTHTISIKICQHMPFNATLECQGTRHDVITESIFLNSVELFARTDSRKWVWLPLTAVRCGSVPVVSVRGRWWARTYPGSIRGSRRGSAHFRRVLAVRE